MAQGNQKASKWAILINAKKKTPSNAISQELRAYLSAICNYTTARNYFAIVHDKDINELGEPKRTHLHLILEYDRKSTFSAVISEIKQASGLVDNQISIEPANSDILAEQYLIHKNDPSKHQYEPTEIETNDRQTLNDRLSARYLTQEEQEAERLEALRNANTFSELIDRAGLEYAHKYRTSFNELRQERKQDYEGLLKSWDTLKKRYINLIRELKQIPIEIEMSNLDIEKIKKLLIDLVKDWDLE